MCGRKTLTRDIQSIIQELAINEWVDPDSYSLSYNIAPTQRSPILIFENSQRVVKQMQWGLIPKWSEDQTIGSKLINARSESLKNKPSFKNLLEKNRCVVITDGYYEWKSSGREKHPYYFHHPQNRLLLMAGLWSYWTSSEKRKILNYTVITTQAKKDLAHIHNRMPVILDPYSIMTWIDTESYCFNDTIDILRTYPHPLNVHPVSQRVNSIHNNSSDCIKSIHDISTLDLF